MTGGGCRGGGLRRGRRLPAAPPGRSSAARLLARGPALRRPAGGRPLVRGLLRLRGPALPGRPARVDPVGGGLPTRDGRAAAFWRTACSCAAVRDSARASALIRLASASFRSPITRPAHTRASTSRAPRARPIPRAGVTCPALRRVVRRRRIVWGEVWPPPGGSVPFPCNCAAVTGSGGREAAQPASTMPTKSAPSAVRPVRAPKTAIPRLEVARACSRAVTPESSTRVYLTISVLW